MIVTIAFAEIMRLVAHNWVDVTRGQMGLAGIQPPRLELLGQVLDFSVKATFYYLVVSIAALSIFAINRIAKSPLGWGFLETGTGARAQSRPDWRGMGATLAIALRFRGDGGCRHGRVTECALPYGARVLS